MTQRYVYPRRLGHADNVSAILSRATDYINLLRYTARPNDE